MMPDDDFMYILKLSEGATLDGFLTRSTTTVILSVAQFSSTEIALNA